MASLLPTPEPPDPVEGAAGHFEHSNWLKQAVKNLDAGTLRNTDDTMMGHLTIDDDGPEANIYMRATSIRAIYGVNSGNNTARWRLALGDQTAEGGGDSGSKFHLNAYSDNGNIKHTVLEADRISGLLTVAANPTAPLGIATKEYVDTAGIPLGSIIAYGGQTAPPGYHICNGTAHGSAALEALIGSALTPDLSGRFILGVSSAYAPKATGGVDAVKLTAAQSGLPAHNHTASTGQAGADHTHSGTTQGHSANHTHTFTVGGGTHTHQLHLLDGTSGSGDGSGFDSSPNQGWNNYPPNGETVANQGSHTHSGTTNGANVSHTHAFSTGTGSANHTHTVAVNNNAAADAALPHTNMPPYYALVYIIKKV